LLNLDTFLQSLLCVVFTLVGTFIKDFFVPSKTPRDWPLVFASSLVIGLGIFFGKNFFPEDFRDERTIAFLCTVGGLAGTPLIKALLMRPMKFFKIWKDIKALGLDEKEKKEKNS